MLQSSLSITRIIFLCLLTLAVAACGSYRSNGGPSGSSGEVPPTPTDLALVAGDGEITARWSKVDDATGYTLYYKEGADFSDSETQGVKSQAVSDGATTSAVISGLTNNLVHYVRVTATNATGESELSDAQTATPLSAAEQIAAGNSHSCAIDAEDGAVKCWGNNGKGQLGNDAIADSEPTPVTVSGLGSGVSAIAAGSLHSCAIEDGAVRCWGQNSNGQLGNDTTADSAKPVMVSGLTSGVSAIVAGGAHSCAVHNGTVKCWGDNGNGQLGDDSLYNRDTPVTVSGLTSGVTAIAAGGAHNCVIHNGAAKCWGNNTNGQIGNGEATAIQVKTPVTVNGLDSGVTAITAGYAHSCAIHNGAAKCWGFNIAGQLGDGTQTQRLTPVDVSGDLASDVSAIVAGDTHSCAIHKGAAWCWGQNSNGQLGDGTIVQKETPVAVKF